MASPFFTVVIPTYNRSSMLKRAIESVLNQTFEDFEIIVVDDHSTDDTSSVARSFSDPRIQYFMNNGTKGACGARNAGIFSAKGKWVAFLDDDDVWLPNKLEHQYEMAQNVAGTVGLICTDYIIFKEKHQRPRIFKNRPSGWVRDKLLYGGVIGCLSSVCVRTEVLSAIEGFDELFPSNQDQDLYLRVAELSEFAYVPKTLVYIYQERRNRIGQNPKGKLEGYIMLRNKYAALIDQNLRLRHRHESYIFTYALILKKKHLVLKSLPWFLLGVLVDFPYCLFTIRTTLLLTYRRRAQIRHLPWS
ncbi:glycosyltransferase family 2 protein [bacterium]|nr:glycosyltransferase family 2 protein [bacterium]